MSNTGMIIGDSVPLPRSFEPGSPQVHETWPVLLAAQMPNMHWIVNCRGGRSIVEVDQLLKTVAHYYRPQVIVLSVGIVDCPYRALTQQEFDLIQRVPFLSRLLQPVVRRNHLKLTEARQVAYTAPAIFRAALQQAARFCNRINAALIYTQILPPGKHMRDVSFAISNNVAAYNRIAADVLLPEQIVNFTNLARRIDELILEDGHHLNAKGHAVFAGEVYTRLSMMGLVSQ